MGLRNDVKLNFSGGISKLFVWELIKKGPERGFSVFSQIEEFSGKKGG